MARDRRASKTQSQPAKTQAGHKPTAGSWPAQCSTSAAPFGKLLATAKPYSSPARPRADTPDSRVVPEPGTVLGAFLSSPRGIWPIQVVTLIATPPSGACHAEPYIVVLVRRVVVVAVGRGQVVRVVVERPATQPTRRTGASVPAARLLTARQAPSGEVRNSAHGWRAPPTRRRSG
jgi:hypothetical protein